MLTHVDDKSRPTMVDVSDKAVTTRTAEAECFVRLPEELRPYFRDGDFHLKKGAVFHTAIIAGTMAAKRTHEIIPFCHQLPLESCKFEIQVEEDYRVRIRCRVKTEAKTGVEMEALHGASVAALTIYDMAKAVSHRIEIESVRLLAKAGGKRRVLDKPLYGLVLTGGQSSRMKRDKALLPYHGMPQAQWAYQLLGGACEKVFLSVAREEQWAGTPLFGLPTLVDLHPGEGPAAGILTALECFPEAYWLVVACDLPLINEKTIGTLLAGLDTTAPATAFASAEGGFPEALAAIYTPAARSLFREALRAGRRCPVKILKEGGAHLLPAPAGGDLRNVNTPEEYAEVSHGIA